MSCMSCHVLYVCIYACVYVYVDGMCACMSACAWMVVCMYMYVCMYVGRYVFMFVCVSSCNVM